MGLSNKVRVTCVVGLMRLWGRCTWGSGVGTGGTGIDA